MVSAKVQLILPPCDSSSFTLSRTGVYPPLSLLVLSAYIREHLPSVEVEILDGTLLGLPQVLESLDGTLVGLSPTIVTYGNAVTIAERAKSIGATVVMGGQHCSALAERILQRRSFVDYVVTGDGEEALADLIVGRTLSSIPNLYSREFGHSCKHVVDLSTLPLPDYDGLDLTPYFSNFQNRFGHWGYNRALPMYSRKGCEWQERTGGCIFCRRQETPVRVKSPDRFWREVRHLTRTYGADLIWDVSDTITMDSEWLDALVRTRPTDIEVSFLVYSRVDGINPVTVRLLKDLGCHEVMVGMESGDSKVLPSSAKGIDVADSTNAARLLSENGISVFPTFILGLPSETADSIRCTHELASTVVETCNVSQIACTPLIPIPGSPAMNMLKARLGPESGFVEDDLLDVESLVSSWLRHFTHVSIDTLLSGLTSILALHDISSSFGSGLRAGGVS